MKLIRLLLLPIVPVYYLVTWFRNTLYDAGIKTSKSYDFPVVCVGNLSTGGTGKTPMVEYLIKLLKSEFNLATLSRGYGRNTKGFLLANDQISAKELGDEPFQFYNAFKEEILVAVDENRQEGIDILRALKKQPDIILLDDAFQHRKVKAGFNILLTTYMQPYFNDILLPTGNLRESRTGAKRANIIVVTKCPKDLSDSEKISIKKQIKAEPNQLICFSSIDYSSHVIAEEKTRPLQSLSKFTLVTGIANATPLLTYLTAKKLKYNHLEFKDHHTFTVSDIQRISESELIVTTEKDYMRLKEADLLKGKLYYLPIVSEIDKASEFDKKIKDFVRANKRI
ncbi:tetraacyldisaccharide 4'-kinase [Lacinutrix neustonica]|uniref:Tetraacyldisaccharide 4'-kinase n=1 Tax=Lacinutrix neustonica TaxID=2980107 RepID=A0A9E8MXR8_9FLAO|nr:tetraacyldisaccharide 4'-kinase [Lacinutrix neustonica]WAC03652.1 tetraacyldisaccharide 4'-kinase [Lacinutrix neustonica]